MQSQLHSSHRNVNTYGQISHGMLEKGYEQDTHHCCEKIRQAYQKARETNHHPGAALKTSCFYKELDAILGSDSTSTTKSPMDTLGGLETTDSGFNPEDKVVDKEVKLEDNVDHMAESSSGMVCNTKTVIGTLQNVMKTGCEEVCTTAVHIIPDSTQLSQVFYEKFIQLN
ncbi:hypothetical protein UY3_01306 [Chelonia mydas]|uniref:Myb/SANT-like DNA-binding domain-containing protein n=1 Tax=Chelonia mydas TaxID=8469 RepID=M7BZZ1_CHEMY|nr:hypothetical protein UY3_01306 [Chelonia mydas]